MKARSVAMILLAASGAWGAGLEPLSSAEACGRCHRSILEAWKSSAHARAMESPLFQDVLELAEADFGAGARKLCLECHSPIAVETGDLKLRQKVSWEGITCDYCHSIRDVSTAGPNPKARVEFSLVKSGPLKDAEAPVHGIAYSAVHTSSVACAPCHEYRNSLGFAVLTTFSEWKASRYASEGKQCQSCHMDRVSGHAVDPKVLRSSASTVNLHQMAGSHSLDQLNKTIKSQLYTAREGDRLKVTLEVANATAGHYVPTGSPMRQLQLEVRADSYDGRHLRQERIYSRSVADRHGTPLTREHFAFFKAAKVIFDTRLAPGEKRTETFWFDIPAGVQTQVKATFWYYYSPMARTESEKRVTFQTLSRLVP